LACSEPEENEDDGALPATQGTAARVEKKFAALTPDEQERKVNQYFFVFLFWLMCAFISVPLPVRNNQVAEVVRFILFSASAGGSVSHAAIAKSLKEMSPMASALTTRAGAVLASVRACVQAFRQLYI
jgi:hypothetical protein